MSNTIFFSLIFAQLFLNGAHAVLLAWADYPRTNEIDQMLSLAKIMANESGITDISFVSFVDTVNL